MTDTESLACIAAALREGRAQIVFGRELESHMDFPGNSETDKGQFLLVAIAVLVLAYWRGSWPVIAGAVALVVGSYWFFWRRIIRQRIRRRFVSKVMGDLRLWRKSWGFTGIALSTRQLDCRSPKGDWRAFAAALSPESAAAPPPAELGPVFDLDESKGDPQAG